MSESISANLVICGAGISGIATAYQLAVNYNMENIILIDPLPPLSMTSDKSMECYRNWWPGPGDEMVRLMNRSIDLLEELHLADPGRLLMNRRGYVYATSNPKKIESIIAGAMESSELGAGPLRIHAGNPGDPAYIPLTDHNIFDAPSGVDILLDKHLIRKHFPHLTEDTVAIVHTRRCGWFAAQQFGMYMLEQAQQFGVQLIQGKVEEVIVESNKVKAVLVGTSDSQLTITTGKFVNAAGPYQKQIGKMLGIDIPVFSELHLKTSINDTNGIVPRDMPLTIWLDPVHLVWSDEEKEMLAETDETRWLVEEMPVGVHGRAEGGDDADVILLQWGYHLDPMEPVFPLPIDPEHAEISLRGLAAVIPGLSSYLDKLPKPFIDGGYYTRTHENRPLIGPLPVEGAYILGGVGGFGMQVSCGAADLLAAHITGSILPDYADAFLLSRYSNPDYKKLLENWGASGQI